MNSINTDRRLENRINKLARSPGLGGLGSDEVREGLWDAVEHILGNLQRSMKSSKCFCCGNCGSEQDLDSTSQRSMLPVTLLLDRKSVSQILQEPN